MRGGVGGRASETMRKMALDRQCPRCKRKLALLPERRTRLGIELVCRWCGHCVVRRETWKRRRKTAR